MIFSIHFLHNIHFSNIIPLIFQLDKISLLRAHPHTDHRTIRYHTGHSKMISQSTDESTMGHHKMMAWLELAHVLDGAFSGFGPGLAVWGFVMEGIYDFLLLFGHGIVMSAFLISEV